MDRIVIDIRPAVGGFEFVIQPFKNIASIQSARREAIALFARMAVLREGESARIGQCAYCHRYYVNKRGRKDSRFCPAPRNCGRHYTATQAVRRRKKEERDQKIRLLQRALRSWTPKKGAKREYLAVRTGISKTFITRAFRHDLKSSARKEKGR